MNFYDFVLVILLLGSIWYLLSIGLESKNWIISILTLIFLVGSLFSNIERRISYAELTKSIIKETNISISKISPKYRSLYIDLKAEIEKEKLQKLNKKTSTK